MNKRMIKALKDKYIYVDIDGTLAEYRFNNHVSAKDGTTNGQTMEEIENHVFLHSRPLKTVIQTLKKAKKKAFGYVVLLYRLWSYLIRLYGSRKTVNVLSSMEIFGLYQRNIGVRSLITLTVVRMIMILLLNMVLSLKVPRIICGIGLSVTIFIN